MLKELKKEMNITYTENGAVSYTTTFSDCLDLFATIGALRSAKEHDIIDRFTRAFAEDKSIAMKILFFGRDIRGGLGERRVFRIITRWLAEHEPEVMRKNIEFIAEYGRYDDLLALLGTACEKDAVEVIKAQLENDLAAEECVSLLAKWLPSVNASNRDTVRQAKKLARLLGMKDAQYRKTLAQLRGKIAILENNLREKDYTFDYSKLPSKAMYKYRKAFIRNDNERYEAFWDAVEKGNANVYTGTLMPYDIVASCFENWEMKKMKKAERRSVDMTWRELEDFGGTENAIVVVDGSGSMYGYGTPAPIHVALSLGIYFAERNKGEFRNHFITFSENPQLVEIKGKDIYEKVAYCTQFCEVANTNLTKVFELILNTAVRYHVPQEEMPEKLYIVSDMEFDSCMEGADMTNFEYAKKLFAEHGYHLPDVVFWNVNSRNCQQPVTMNEQGVALVSGCTPRLFSMIAGEVLSPYILMIEVLEQERYQRISA